jgi:hypothetical protein
MTLAGRLVAAPILVIEIEEVFVAKITFCGVMEDNSLKIFSFKLVSSLTACAGQDIRKIDIIILYHTSTTKSTFSKSLKLVEGLILAKVSFFSCSVNLFFATALVKRLSKKQMLQRWKREFK